ncbi:hypothetical protein DUNSADRAFT_697 [Dunaliella salina]|uniref:Uncharacterized protein n=1 Tax=Dunaliella salina TaxID=3046 RepID=A0ABQ7FYH1_DUNSA|nr:hypothetical protein DUNSADRAFT_697 [Dunaliella salina]|eukprot:KAF5827418.1 hypothetical protein DUNSADRAFT_697 [Dunaliella salina]
MNCQLGARDCLSSSTAGRAMSSTSKMLRPFHASLRRTLPSFNLHASWPASASTSEASSATAARPVQQQAGSTYKLPPQEITDIVDAPAEPGLTYSPDRKHFLQMFRPPALPSISEISRPELKLAGLRIDPELFARSKMGFSTGLAILPSDQVVPAAPDNKFIKHIKGYPEGSCLNYAMWSPDGRHVSFTTRSPGASPSDPPRAPLELWIADVETGTARCLLGRPNYGLNTIFDDYTFLDDDNIVACVLPKGVSAETAPKRPTLGPQGPRISDNTAGAKSQNRTWPDLLKDEHDELLFEHYGQSELVRVNIHSGEVQHIAPPRLYTDMDVSPDGRYLLVGWLERPYSFNVPCGRFPRRVQLWHADGTFGPRGFDWRSDKPCEFTWMEAQDGGDAAVEASPRDIVYALNADEASAAASSSSNSEGAPLSRRTRWGTYVLAKLDGERKLLMEGIGASEEGNKPFLSVLDLDTKETKMLWQSAPPFFELPGSILNDTDYDKPISLNNLQMLWSRESAKEVPQSFVRTYTDGGSKFTERQVTNYPHPHPQLKDLQREVLRYPRNDGVMLTATLYTPPGYKADRDGPLPCVLWAYPREFKSKDAAGQMRRSRHRHFHAGCCPHRHFHAFSCSSHRHFRAGCCGPDAAQPPPSFSRRMLPLPSFSRIFTHFHAAPTVVFAQDAAGQMRRSPHQFAYIGSQSPMLWLTRGYAVLDGPTLPIVAEGDEEPNDALWSSCVLPTATD